MSMTTAQVFELASNQQLWAGHLIDTTAPVSETTLPNYSPIDNTCIGSIANGSQQDVNTAVAAARDAFEQGEWRRRLLLLELMR
ncbi:aldehyde dehydrogenase family protein [Psychrobacter sp. ER1]|uniref:aldehyde dehydrogenase family protein n=1 Tax=Psychrobacter sp. ER1 TaxID=3406645 RepID=UPI003B42852E